MIYDKMREMLKFHRIEMDKYYLVDERKWAEHESKFELLTELLTKAKQQEGEVIGMTAKEVLLKYFPTNEYMHPPIPVGEIPKLIEAMEFYASQPQKGDGG